MEKRRFVNNRISVLPGGRLHFSKAGENPLGSSASRRPRRPSHGAVSALTCPTHTNGKGSPILLWCTEHLREKNTRPSASLKHEGGGGGVLVSEQ